MSTEISGHQYCIRRLLGNAADGPMSQCPPVSRLKNERTCRYGTNKFSDRTPAELQLTHKMPRRHAIVGRWAAQWRRQDGNAGATHCEDAGNCQWKQECYACSESPPHFFIFFPLFLAWA